MAEDISKIKKIHFIKNLTAAIILTISTRIKEIKNEKK
jgi:hypothetical protein